MAELVVSRPASVVAEPVFESVHQALLFAYTFTACQHAQTAVAERQIMLMGRERYERVRHIGRGLKGLDGSAQAGMIKRHVLMLPPSQRAVIEARFAVLDEKTRRLAMQSLVLFMRKTGHPIELRFISCLVQQQFGAKLDVRALAAELRIVEKTAYRRAKQIRERLDLLDERAFAQLDERLTVAGVVARA